MHQMLLKISDTKTMILLKKINDLLKYAMKLTSAGTHREAQDSREGVGLMKTWAEMTAAVANRAAWT